jgi:hypothetical protein
MNSQAFTVSSNGILDTIITPISFRQSQNLCCRFNLKGNTVDILALWDTGAQGSCVNNRVAKLLGLTSIAQCEVAGINGIHRSNIYLADIMLPNNLIVTDVQVTEFFNKEEYDAIIGMDIIALGDFSISNYDKKTMISFRVPPGKPVDFTKENGSW